MNENQESVRCRRYFPNVILSTEKGFNCIVIWYKSIGHTPRFWSNSCHQKIRTKIKKKAEVILGKIIFFILISCQLRETPLPLKNVWRLSDVSGFGQYRIVLGKKRFFPAQSENFIAVILGYHWSLYLYQLEQKLKVRISTPSSSAYISALIVWWSHSKRKEETPVKWNFCSNSFAI